jgi:glycosyltransferase involved in cell wall biosynthesis
MLRLIGKKVIYDVHENNPAALLSRPYLKRKFTRIILSKTIKLIEKLSSRYFSAIITARPDISLLFAKHKPFTLRNFPILPDYDKIKDIEIEKKKPSVIYVGGMTEIRGTLELIKAFEQIDEAELWLLGGFGSKEFEQRCRKLEGWKKVKYLGLVEADQIFSYIKKADIGIVTFLPKPNHITTLATKPFEYMACGLPMIMSDFEYWKDFFKDSTLYVNPADENEIAKKIKELLGDKELMHKMGEKNLELIKNEYNWEKESQVLIDAYDFVINQK